MEQLSFIEQIAFDNGQTLSVKDLPEVMQTEVMRYNVWTEQSVSIQRELKELEAQLLLLSYARKTAYSTIETLAQQLGVASRETLAPTAATSDDPAAVEDVLQSESEGNS